MIRLSNRLRAAALILAFYIFGANFATAGTLMPPGEVTFFDNNGLPLSSGCVFFYVPGTTTPKATYQNSAQTIANTNPVQLDAAGRAIIYGTGTYRQVVDATGPNSSSPCSPPGVQIWDQLTASTDSSVTIYAGASSGTPNSITVNAPAFSGADGQVINYISTNTNTAAATFNPSGFGNVQIVRDSATGPGALTGGELVATNAVSLIYDATAGVFHILSPVTWPTATGVPVGTIIAVGGFAPPGSYVFANGQAISRTTFAPLFAAYTSAQSASLSSGSPTITGLTDTTQFGRGQVIEAVGIPASTTIQNCTPTTCTLSANATATRSGTVTVFAYGDGDGSTTFNLPDLRGRGLTGRDNMGGTAGNISQLTTNLSTTNTSATATVASATGLALGMTIAGNANVLSGTTISAISGTTITLSAPATATQTAAARFSIFPDAQGLGVNAGILSQTLVTANLPPYTPAGTNAPTANGGGNVSVLPNAPTATLANVGSAFGVYSTTQWFQLTVPFTGTPQGGLDAPFSLYTPTANINWAVKLTP